MESTADLLIALAMLAAILTAIIAPVVWIQTRSGKTPQCVAVLAARYALQPQPSSHRRMLFFAGTVDGFRMEVANHVNAFDRFPPTPMRSSIARNLVIRVIRAEPIGQAFTIDNAYGSETGFGPGDFGLHHTYRIRTQRPVWLERVLADKELVAILNGFCEPQGYRRFVLAAVNESGAVGLQSEPTEESAAAAAEQLLRLMQILRERCACTD